MANVNPFGPNRQTGQPQNLGVGDRLITTANSYIGSTGAIGISGLRGHTGISSIAQGLTGIGVQGSTGISGNTGLFGLQGDTGLQAHTGIRGSSGFQYRGATGLLGVTGLQGATGLIGVTGIIGVGGYTGISGGYTGLAGLDLQGHTGIQGRTGVGVLGLTGLQGLTGLPGETGLVGHTGVSIQGITGISGSTGLQGSTGLLDQITLSAQQQISGMTMLYAVTTGTTDSIGQQLEFYCSGISATDGANTTIAATFGGYQIFNDTVSLAGGSDIQLYGLIYRVGVGSQDVSIRSTYESGDGSFSWQNINANLGFTTNLIVSVSSAGTGHALFTLTVRRIEEASDSS